MNSIKTLALAASIAGCANLKVSGKGLNALAAMVCRRRLRGATLSHAAVLLLGTICGPVFAQNWILEVPDNTPPGRNYSAMANDGASGQVVLFGGNGNSGYLSDTWSWNGADWTKESPKHSPPARFGHVMAYDAAHGKVVLFGGGGDGSLNDTWVWNGTDWTQEMPATSPPARDYATMKYDAARGQVVLFGGVSPDFIYLSDTWIWNGKNWTQVDPGTSPPARLGAAMAYDAADQKVLLFGGSNAESFFGDTWAWDGSNWIQQSPAASPSARSFAGMAYDSDESKVILLGGNNASPLNDTWAWDGTNWALQNPADFPSASYAPAMAPDPQGNVVMFGGYTHNSGFLSDTWVWATGPKASLNPTSLSFGKQKVKTGSKAKEVKLTNSGNNTLTIHSIAFTGSDSKDFQKSTNCGGSLKPGFACTINVTFKPTAKGARSAKLVIKDNGQNGSQSIALSGTGD